MEAKVIAVPGRTRKSNNEEVPQPSPALKRLDPLVGTWSLTGTVAGREGEVNGVVSFEWIAAGFFLCQRFQMNFLGKNVEGMEIIGYDPVSGTFKSTTYSNLDESEAYYWDLQGGVVTHCTKGTKYTGKFSHGGNTLTGRWEPEEGKKDEMNVEWDSVMVRVG